MKHWVDLDGTLVDSFSLYFECLGEIFPKYGARFTPDLKYAALTEPLVPFFSQHLGSDAVTPGELQTKSDQDTVRIRPFQGIMNSIQHLAVQGRKVAIWTNRDLSSAQLIVQHSGLGRFVGPLVSGTCVSRRKPDPEGLLRIIDSFGCNASEVTVVGDHEHDVVAAKAVGARSVRASWHSYWPMERCPHSDLQFHDVSAFSEWIRTGATSL